MAVKYRPTNFCTIHGNVFNCPPPLPWRAYELDRGDRSSFRLSNHPTIALEAFKWLEAKGNRECHRLAVGEGSQLFVHI